MTGKMKRLWVAVAIAGVLVVLLGVFPVAADGPAVREWSRTLQQRGVGIDPDGRVEGGPIVEANVQIVTSADGEFASDSFGWVGAKIGDITGDGRDDFITTAPLYTTSTSFRGKVYVYSGNGTLLASHTGNPGDVMGYSAASAGDVNNDGVNDYIIGGYGSYNAGTRGKAWIYSGATRTLIRTLQGEPGAAFGSGVAGIGDINGDGFGEVVVGSEYYSSTLGSPPPNGTGRVYLFSGVDGAVVWTREGANASDWLGSAVGPIGDLNGDGIKEVVAGARGANNGNGMGYVFSGADGSTVYTLTATAPFSQSFSYGQFFAFGAGDITNDGTDDIYIGDYGALNGDGRVYLYSGADGSLFRTINAFAPGEGIGGGRGMPDINNDGYDDLIVAAYTSNAGASGGGKVYLLSGADNTILHTITGNVAGDLLGVDALEVGDVNGDGNRDYMVTAVGHDFAGTGVGHMYVVTIADPTPITLGSFDTSRPTWPWTTGLLLVASVGLFLKRTLSHR